MMWFFAILVVLVMGGVAALAAGRGAPMTQAYDDRPDALVPRDGLLEAEHVRKVRFSLAFRGYRMSEVDALLDRVASQLELAEGPPLLPDATAGPEASDGADVADHDEVADTPDVREVRGDRPPQ